MQSLYTDFLLTDYQETAHSVDTGHMYKVGQCMSYSLQWYCLAEECTTCCLSVSTSTRWHVACSTL